MGILAWIIFGALAGWLASIITGRNNQMGCITNIIVGVVGAFLGGFIMSFIGGSGVTGFNLYSFFVAILGAVVLLAILGVIRR
ncbi:MAG: GlsB/YeaQ/YmgE family stress response membrane protein [Anaerolineaceae bacterium]|nr:GlsB/YeaQ/YmgE family stress response membrane protein [Anaerolineaceae bacterium]MCB9100754.1 GlsB/YeaQ/YmgE family stress response membrane protein [Anaerolineales bacterium]